MSNPHELLLYLSDANPIIKQLEEVEEIEHCKCENWSKGNPHGYICLRINLIILLSYLNFFPMLRINSKLVLRPFGLIMLENWFSKIFSFKKVSYINFPV